MYCNKCGKEITDDSAFCNGCGTKIELQQAPKEFFAEQAYAKSGKQSAVIIIISLVVFFCVVIMMLTAKCSREKDNVLQFEKIAGKNEYRVIGVEEINDDKLTIPSEYNGCPVTEIGVEAFSSSDFLEIDIPNTIVTIEARAFQYCQNIKKVNIPNSVEYIGYQAFWDCRKLEEVIIGNNIQEIQPEAFRYCDALRSVKFTNPDDIRLFGVTFKNGFLENPEGVAKYFTDEQFSCRHWYSKDHPLYGNE